MHSGNYNRRSTGRPKLLRLALAALLSVCIAEAAVAANHPVAAQDASFDCSSVKPGDTITLGSGTRGPLTIKNCNGTASNPIVIRNDPAGAGPTVIQRNSTATGGFVFWCTSCVGVSIDGSARWIGAPPQSQHGIKITMTGGEGPSAFLMVSGLSRLVTIRNVEIDGMWPKLANDGIGIHVKAGKLSAADYPDAWIEGIVIENCSIRNVEGEGLYIGPNWYDGSIPLRNIVIRGNTIENTGWDGIQLKSAIGGNNEIHHNVLRRIGLRSDAKSEGQLTGISLLDGNGRIYNNWVESVGDSGIKHYLQYLPESRGNQSSEIFNNVIVQTGQIGLRPSHGIVSNNATGSARPLPKIYYNTVIRTKDSGISVGPQAAGGYIRDNIVAEAAQEPISAPSNVTKSNNRVGSIADMAFVDAASLDLSLKPDSPARNAGGSGHPDTDYLDAARPADGVADQGAFEYSGTSPVRPSPPAELSIR